MFLFQIIDFIKKISNFDDLMHQAYPNCFKDENLSRTKVYSILSCLFVSSLIISVYIIDIICFFPKRISIFDTNGIITYCTPLVISSIMVLQFSTLMVVLRERFNWINKELELMKNRWNRYNFPLGCKNLDIHSVMKHIDYL